MSRCFYLDASALVKLYVQEVGSVWMRQITAALSPSQMYLSRVAKVEFTSALTRKLRTGEIIPIGVSSDTIRQRDADATQALS